MVKEKVFNETEHEKFKRIARGRTKKILRMLGVLGNCSNRSIYAYTKKDINLIFSAIEKETKRVRALFNVPASEEFEL